MNKRNEIGGGYWLTKSEVDKVQRNLHIKNNIYFISQTEQHLSTCRSALQYIAGLYEKKIIAIPYFTCSTVIDSFSQNGWTVIPFKIKEDFKVDWTDLTRIVREGKPSLILMHSYFGFPTINDNPECIAFIKGKGIDIINDVTCSLLSTYKRIKSDYYVASIRKWFPVPDGALLVGACIPGVNRFNKDLLDSKIDAFTTKAMYLSEEFHDKTAMLKKFSLATAIVDAASKPFDMTPFSTSFLNGYEIEEARIKRRNNHNRLYNILSQILQIKLPLQEASEDIVPYLLPVLVEERNTLQKYLADNGVYATVLWTKPKTFETVNFRDDIYDKILCFPINQSYDICDMDRIGELMYNYYNIR